MDTTIVEQATILDLPQLTDLLHDLFSMEPDFKPDRAKQMRGLQLILEQPNRGRIFVLRHNGMILGMINLLFTISTAEGGRSAWLEDMVVHPYHRNRGLGRRLMRHALQGAEALGCTRVTLLTDGINSGAMRFYKRAGFQRSDMVPFRLHFPPPA